MLLQKMDQNGIFPRKKSIVFPVSVSPKETWQKWLLIGMSSAVQVLTAVVPPQPQVTQFLFDVYNANGNIV